MDFAHLPDEFFRISEQLMNRRKFFHGVGAVGLGAMAAPLLLSALDPTPLRADERESSAEAASEVAQAKDTVAEIATAALIAEDLATTFYYNGLVGNVIQDPSLAGSGGSATHVTSQGNVGNVNYIQAALSEEIAHANLLRTLLKIPTAGKDPAQTFYFPAGTFDSIGPFLALLDALENAFIGAYLNAVQEFGKQAAWVRSQEMARRKHDDTYSPEQLVYLSKVSASIMGIESEHRVLGRVISNSNPANNRNYEQTDNITAVYNGANSAVKALTPFLTASTGPAYSLGTALEQQGSVSLPVAGNPPSF